jgi:hypothetical protein
MSGYTYPYWLCSIMSFTLHRHRLPHQVRDFEIKKVPVPSVGPDDVLLEGVHSLANSVGLRPHISKPHPVNIRGLCGTDVSVLHTISFAVTQCKGPHSRGTVCDEATPTSKDP